MIEGRYHIVFVDNLLVERRGAELSCRLQPHLGLLSLASIAEESGFKSSIFDPKFLFHQIGFEKPSYLLNRCAEDICALSPDIIGYTSLGCNFLATWKLATLVKDLLPNVPALVGGPHATILHREIANGNSPFDVVFRNEAEDSMGEYLGEFPNIEFGRIAGITAKSPQGPVDTGPPGAIQSLSSLPIPAYNKYPPEYYTGSRVPVEAGRGCPFSCTFCSTATFFGRLFRMKDVEQIVTEILFLKEVYGQTKFDISHDLFTVDKRVVKSFCCAIKTHQVTWTCSARTDCVDQELLADMKNAGCTGIYFGIETGSKKMQEASRKRLKEGSAHAAISSAQDLGLHCTLSYIVGFPEEQKCDIRFTLDEIGSNHQKYAQNTTCQVHVLTPEPGTRLIEKYGHTLQKDDYVTDFSMPHFDSLDTEIVENNPLIFCNELHYPSPAGRMYTLFVAELSALMLRLPNYLFGAIMETFGTSFGGFCELLFDRSPNITLSDRRSVLMRVVHALVGYCNEKLICHDTLTKFRILMALVCRDEDLLICVSDSLEVVTEKPLRAHAGDMAFASASLVFAVRGTSNFLHLSEPPIQSASLGDRVIGTILGFHDNSDVKGYRLYHVEAGKNEAIERVFDLKIGNQLAVAPTLQDLLSTLEMGFVDVNVN